MSGKRIKILHVVFSLDAGGMENGLVNVARRLNPAEFEVHVCCLNRRGAFAERIPNPNNVYALGRTEGFDRRALLKLFRLISQIQPDVIHPHNLGPLMYSSLATLFGLRCRVVQGEHSLLDAAERSPKRLWQRRVFYRSCRKVHTVSFGQRDQLLRLSFPEEKIVTIVNGVDTTRFVPGEKYKVRQQLGLFPADSQVIGIVGRFAGVKRHIDLLEAFDLLEVENPKLHLLIVGGGGPEAERVSNRAKASRFSDRIHLTGFQKEPALFYQTMDLLAVPSILEGMSNVVLEAMACETPVLAHHACGNAEMLVSGEDGVISDLSTVDKLRCELQRMLSDATRLSELGRRARQNVIAKFSLQKMVEGYEALYRSVCGS